jgi:predicted nuclease of predicted toxin-antitoxin system
VKFVIDENLPPALAALRVKQGHDCVHVAYAGLAGAADDAIRDFARTEHRVIVTRDGDFDLPDEAVQVLKIEIGNCSNAVLLARVSPRLDEAIASLGQGDALVRID